MCYNYSRCELKPVAKIATYSETKTQIKPVFYTKRFGVDCFVSKGGKRNQNQNKMEYVASIIQLPELGLRQVGRVCQRGFLHVKDHFIPHARNNYHPHLLGDRALALMSGALVLMKISVIAFVSWGPVLPAYSSAITVSNIINLTNQSRASYSLAALTENNLLDQAAQAKADDMLAKGYFAHTTPSGQTPWDFITKAGYNYLMAGENLAVNFTQAEDVETAWMNSPGHKANILNKNFEQIGIGISQGAFEGHNAIFVVQMFGVPAEQKITLTNTPTPVQTASVPAPALPQASPAASPKAGQPVVKTWPGLEITDGQTQVQGGAVNIIATISGPASKVLAYFGPQQAVMLLPTGEQTWSGQISLADLAKSNTAIRLQAFDIRGQSASLQLAEFAGSTLQNFDVLGASTVAPPTAQINWLGRMFDLKGAEENFYLFFVAGLLSSLILAIGIKRHIQHLNLIANTSLVAIFAMLLWMAG